MTDKAATPAQATMFDVTAQGALWLAQLFAPWVQALGLQVVSARGGEAMLRLPFADTLCREGGSICGQALMSSADTAMVFAISSLFGEFRPTTTVSQNISFLRPVTGGEVSVQARVLRPGRQLMFGEIELSGSDGRLVAHATTTYAML